MKLNKCSFVVTVNYRHGKIAKSIIINLAADGHFVMKLQCVYVAISSQKQENMFEGGDLAEKWRKASADPLNSH